jgi:hypothetical protein
VASGSVAARSLATLSSQNESSLDHSISNLARASNNGRNFSCELESPIYLLGAKVVGNNLLLLEAPVFVDFRIIVVSRRHRSISIRGK